MPCKTIASVQAENADIRAENARLSAQAENAELFLHDLVKGPVLTAHGASGDNLANAAYHENARVVWISHGTGETRVTWGLARPTTHGQGGLVLRRFGSEVVYSMVETLDDLARRLPSTHAIQVTSRDPELRQQAENEREVMVRALDLRRRLFKFKREARHD